MARKRKSEENVIAKPKEKIKVPKAKKSKKPSELSDYDDSDLELKCGDPSIDLDPLTLPPKETLFKLLDRIESQLPKDDHVKFDSRARKLDWEKIKFDELSAEECSKYWYYIQERIRRYRIMAELIPDARTWITHPWTNFYKSKDHNRHPDMPKKPLSMYMLFYSEKREEILKDNPSLSMPEVAKICSEQYQKLSEKKKARYKQRCDEMRRNYEDRLKKFFEEHPDLKPVKPDKLKKSNSIVPQRVQPTQQLSLPTHHHHLQPAQQHQPVSIQEAIYYQQPIMQGAPQQQQQMVVLTSGPQDQVYMMAAPTTTRPLTAYPAGSTVISTANIGSAPSGPPIISISATAQEHQQPAQQHQMVFPSAPEKPAKPFDLFFKHQMDAHAGDANFDRQSAAEGYRHEWKTMKLKKKAKWIKKAADNFREYEEKVVEFCAQNPSYVRPHMKNFLTVEDQRILDKFMGRPEKPPSSAYSLFSKEMLNSMEIKKFPSKERMAQISEKWKLLPQEQRDCYQAEVNRSMTEYRHKYEEWFNGLSEAERKAETSRMNSNKNSRKAATAPAKGQASLNVIKQDLAQPQPTPANLVTIDTAIPINLGSMMSTGLAGAIPIVSLANEPLPVKNERETLLASILQREPREPPRSQKQLFIVEYLAKHKKKKLNDAKEMWRMLDKVEKKKWPEKLELQRQAYIEEYTRFVRALDKDELEMYTEVKRKRDEEEEAKRQNESSDSDSSESEDDDDSSDSEESESDESDA